MKTLSLIITLFFNFTVAAQANICDPAAQSCAQARLNFTCKGTYVRSSLQTAPNVYDVVVVCDNTRHVNVQVTFDGLSCRCTRVTYPGDGG